MSGVRRRSTAPRGWGLPIEQTLGTTVPGAKTNVNGAGSGGSNRPLGPHAVPVHRARCHPVHLQPQVLRRGPRLQRPPKWDCGTFSLWGALIKNAGASTLIPRSVEVVLLFLAGRPIAHVGSRPIARCAAHRWTPQHYFFFGDVAEHLDSRKPPSRVAERSAGFQGRRTIWVVSRAGWSSAGVLSWSAIWWPPRLHRRRGHHLVQLIPPCPVPACALIGLPAGSSWRVGRPLSNINPEHSGGTRCGFFCRRPETEPMSVGQSRRAWQSSPARGECHTSARSRSGKPEPTR